MKHFQFLYLLIILILFTSSLTEALDFAKKGCEGGCGRVSVPYPFGIGANCSVNKWYTVNCNSSIPYLSAFNNLELLEVHLDTQSITVNSSQILSIDLDGTPFLISESRNIFAVMGCGNAAILLNGRVITGCSTYCPNDTIVDKDYCFGVGCCQTTIPYYLKSYRVDVTNLEGLGGDGSFGSAFLVDKSSYVNNRLSGGEYSFVPVSLLWTLTDHDLNEVAPCWESERSRPTLYVMWVHLWYQGSATVV